MKKIIIALCIVVGAQGAHAFSHPDALSYEDVFQAYRQAKEIGAIPALKVPTVVEIPLGSEHLERHEFVVFDLTEGAFQPNVFGMESVHNPVPFSILAESYGRGSVRFPERMIDGNTNTYGEALLLESQQGTVTFTMRANSPITSTGLTLLLDQHVAVPTTVEIHANVEGENRIVLASTRMVGNSIRFPKTTAATWNITFSYAQPLRISELTLLDERTADVRRVVRFLAQPDHAYRLFLDPDRPVRPETGQLPNLTSSDGILILPFIPSATNPMYRPADVDMDSIPDMVDNCVSVANQNQEDVDGNGRGDACDDFDRDGVISQKDNCPNAPNTGQQDEDGDGVGDVCDDEESRLTERYPWIPWAGMGIAGVVLLILFLLAARSLPAREQIPHDMV